MFWVFLLFYVNSFLCKANQLEDLGSRVKKLENIVHNFEDFMVKRYGLIRHCVKPESENGRTICPHPIKTDTKCWTLCNPGFIQTPGHQNTVCQSDGTWSIQLKCEIPMVIISGGRVREGVSDSSVEIYDLFSSKRCKPFIAGMPLVNNTERILHNLMYDPIDSNLLACNGLSGGEATCHSWKLQPPASTWNFHSYPNKGSKMDMTMDKMASRVYQDNDSFRVSHPNFDKGRYAAESLTIDGKLVIVGGMIYNETIHEASDSFRMFNGKHWTQKSLFSYVNIPRCELLKPRAFFCAVQLDNYAAVYIGGFRNKTVISDVHCRSCKTVPVEDLEFKKFYRKVGNMADLPYPLSGHGCTLLPSKREILVSGGQRFEEDVTQAQTFVYSWGNNTWSKQWDMNVPRFGHKVVNVGGKIFAIGGKHNDHDYINSIEQYQMDSGKWNQIDLTLKKPRAHFGLALVPRSILGTC